MKIEFTVFCCLFLMLSAACGTQKMARYEPVYSPTFLETQRDNGNSNTFNGFVSKEINQVPATVPQKRKIIAKDASLTLTVKNPDTVAAKISRFVESTEGINQSVSNTYLVVKVKEELLDSALKYFSSLGRKEYLRVSAQDLTGEYHDLQIRLENAEKARKRYLELLEKAANVQEILLVEKELERLNRDIDLLKAQISNIDMRDTYSTINITLKEKTKPGPLGYIFIGLYKGVKWLFVRN